jgi:uncharacterized membrane protein (DUF373 family)
MEKPIKLFEKFIVVILIVLMVLIIIISTVVLALAILRYILNSPNYIQDEVELLDLFGYVLLILIGLELLETIKSYLSEHVFHVEVVMEVALIAVARKVILLDYKEYPPLTILAIASLILALSIGFFLEKRGRYMKLPPEEKL